MIRVALVMALGGGLLLAGPVWAGNAAAGKAKSEMCADCHGDNGKGDADNPGIAGMSVHAFTKAMKAYRSGAHGKSRMMIKAAKKLSDQDIADLAAYYASLPK